MASSLSGNGASADVAMAPQITSRWRDPSVSTQPKPVRSRPRVDAEDPHASDASISFSSMSKFDHT